MIIRLIIIMIIFCNQLQKIIIMLKYNWLLPKSAYNPFQYNLFQYKTYLFKINNYIGKSIFHKFLWF